jgi:CheY-like chemotaxis protein
MVASLGLSSFEKKYSDSWRPPTLPVPFSSHWYRVIHYPQRFSPETTLLYLILVDVLEDDLVRGGKYGTHSDRGRSLGKPHFLSTILGYGGHQIIEASDGAEALRLTKERHPALAIIDILMPTMDGYEFTRRLRADPDIAHTPIIFYTATYREREARDMAKPYGIVANCAEHSKKALSFS